VREVPPQPQRGLKFSEAGKHGVSLAKAHNFVDQVAFSPLPLIAPASLFLFAQRGARLDF
jgi:hypothetical protein